MNGIVVAKDGWREKLETLAGRRFEAWVVAGLVVVVAGVALMLWFRGSAPTIAPPAQAVAIEEESLPASIPSSPALSPVLVHVAGAVRNPGLYELAEGARVADAIESAGGSRSPADLNALNLASIVTDGMQVLVPSRRNSSPQTTSSVPAATPATPGSVPINLNAADQVMLETIPGIGPVTAAAILEYRDSIGSYSSINELIDVSGIGPATLEAIRPYVVV